VEGSADGDEVGSTVEGLEVVGITVEGLEVVGITVEGLEVVGITVEGLEEGLNVGAFVRPRVY
jgi:hypothetical protein